MAEEQDKSQQTEEPTQKKIDDARKKGQVPQSKEPSTALAFLVGASIGVTGIGLFVGREVMEMTRTFLSGAITVTANGAGMQELLITLGKSLALSFLPIALPIMIVSMLVSFMVTGPVISFESLKPKFSKVSPMKGLKRLFSTKALAEFVKSLLKLIVISLACWVVVSDLWPKAVVSSHADPAAIAGLAADGSLALFALVAFIFMLIAIADVFYQRWEHTKSLRMSQKEIRDEHKESEGDPHLKAKVRQIQQEMARNRMMADVPKADVVITNPTHIAIALKYDPAKGGAPRVLAKGKGKVAEAIREKAREHGVPIRQNVPLARSLFKHVRLGEEIPDHLYEAVAIILAEIFRLKAAR